MNKLVLLIAMNIVMTTQTYSQPNSLKISKKHLATIDSLINQYWIIDDFSGVVLIGKNDSIVSLIAKGKANRSLNVPHNYQTNFSVGSISKSFTGYLINDLINKGLLNPEEPISNYLDSLHVDVGQVTLEQILGHLSGIWHYNKYEDYRSEIFPKEQSVEEFVNLYIKDGLRRKPNTVRSYSSIAYNLAGLIAESVTNKPLSELYNEIFTNLGMNSSYLLEQDIIIPDYSSGYRFDVFRGYLNERYRHPNTGYAGGGIVSNAPDLLKWCNHLNQLYKADTGNRFFHPIRNKNGEEEWEGYAYGLSTYLPMASDTLKAFWHEGQFGGSRTVFVAMPNHSINIVILCNTRGVPVLQMAKNIIDLIRFNSIPYPPKQPYISLMWDEISYGKIENAIMIYEDLKEISSTRHNFDDPFELNYLGNYLIDNSRDNEALQIFKLASNNYPEDTDSRIAIAKIHFDNKQLNEAENYILKALEIDPTKEEAKELFNKIKLSN